MVLLRHNIVSSLPWWGALGNKTAVKSGKAVGGVSGGPLLTYYQINYFSVEVTFSPYMNPQFCRVFSPPTSHKCSCSHPLHVRDSNHTHPLTSLQ